MGWCIYYDDGSTFSSEDGPPEAAAADGVELITDLYPDGTRRVWERCDYYWWLGESWAGGSSKDLDRHLRTLGHIKFGRMMNDGAFQRLRDRAYGR